ncbi:hypothetical protein P171DRAFT_489557 [Karstenula rhodostoma CBS 690.94]|uniref:F-box domain-containing protein n=1 Tax=Karstenula rhodostoma CBS 690.94 TaxID=1392251 RepID=A0A9P4P9J3_9PLEO|nr:hypothetical protein P171DRAFT_489557 [Karstenula rhodostoma CBS 690.94]
MAYLLDLPTETIQEIIEYVALCHRPLVDLKALCLTCKAACNIAQPMIYHHFIFDGKRHWQKSSLGEKLLCFADTLARHPELRKSVKELELALQSIDYAAKETESFVPSDFDLGGLRSAAPQYFNTNKKRDM